MSELVHVALVGDDGDRRRSVAHALGRAGWLVTEVRDAEAGLSLLRSEEIAVVVIDLASPGEGGRSLLSEVVGGFPDVSVVVLGVDDVAGAVSAMQRGACDYVSVHADGRHLQEIPQAVWRALGRRRRLRAQRRARSEPETLATALCGLADGVAIVDTIGRVAFVNAALANAWGAPTPKILGRSLSEFVQVPGADNALATVLSQAESSGRWSGQLAPRRSEAAALWDVTWTPIVRPRASSALVGIFRDAPEPTGGKGLGGDALSLITHDIKSPLAVIMGYADLLTDGGVSPQTVQDTLVRIRESGEQINTLVSNVLEVTRIESGRLVLDRDTVDVTGLVAQVVEQVRGRAIRKGVELAIDGGAGQCEIDARYVERALYNVLANAVKFTPSGGRITIDLAAGATGVAVRVIDSGPGIAEDQLAHVFAKFRHGRPSGRHDGTGLGLFVARAIVEAHGGTLTAESAVGHGARFTMSLPHRPG